MDDPITVEEVKKAVVDLGTKKATGQDGIPYYPAYTPHVYTLHHLCQVGGACYQRVRKPELFLPMPWVRGRVAQGWKTPFKYLG